MVYRIIEYRFLYLNRENKFLTPLFKKGLLSYEPYLRHKSMYKRTNYFEYSGPHCTYQPSVFRGFIKRGKFRNLSNNNKRDILSIMHIKPYFINRDNNYKEIDESVIDTLHNYFLYPEQDNPTGRVVVHVAFSVGLPVWYFFLCDSFKNICMTLLREILFVSCRLTTFELSSSRVVCCNIPVSANAFTYFYKADAPRLRYIALSLK